MNPPQVYMCAPPRTLLPPPSPFHPSGSSQCTSPKHPVSRTFLNETDICFHGSCVVRVTATVWGLFDSRSRDRISAHHCFPTFSAKANKMKNATNVVIQL